MLHTFLRYLALFFLYAINTYRQWSARHMCIKPIRNAVQPIEMMAKSDAFHRAGTSDRWCDWHMTGMQDIWRTMNGVWRLQPTTTDTGARWSQKERRVASLIAGACHELLMHRTVWMHMCLPLNLDLEKQRHLWYSQYHGCLHYN